MLPVIVEIPAGSILFFSALMHAGYGIWSLDEMLIRPVPSMDDMMRTSISDLLIRYQAHVARPKQHNSFKSIDPTETVRNLTSISIIAYNSHFSSHPSSPLTMSGWVKNWSTTEVASWRDTKRHYCLERQKACRAWRMSFMRHMNPELQPSKTKATHKTCEQDEGNAQDV